MRYDLRLSICLLFLLVARYETYPVYPVAEIEQYQIDPFEIPRPEQVHIALTNIPQEMMISWVTPSYASSIVKYGLKSEGKLTLQTQAFDPAFQYTYGKTIEYISGFVHHVKLTDLLPDTDYIYRCGDGTDAGSSSQFEFRTSPSPGPEVPLILGVLGDLGQTKYSEMTVQHLLEAEPLHAVLHVGDLSYADGFQPRWDRWGRMVEPATSRQKWMYAAGNHEMENVYAAPGEDPFVAFQSRFRLPSAHKHVEGNLYYSYVIGSAQMIVLCSYTDFTPTSKQYQWLQSTLASVDRVKTPWLVAYFHAPWYNSNLAHQNETECIEMPKNMEQLLYNAKVDIVFAGHVHAYERVHRVYKGQLDPMAPVYVNIGDGGNREGLASTYMDPPPEWSAFRQASFGHGILQIYNSTYAAFSWHRDVDGERIVTDMVPLTHPPTQQ